jgi:hypothetical protein
MGWKVFDLCPTIGDVIIQKMVIKPKIRHLFEVFFFGHLFTPIVQIDMHGPFFPYLNDLESEPFPCFPFLERIYVSDM